MAKILVVEDDTRLVDELTRILGENGYEVVVVDDFANVVETVLKSRADLVLLDVGIPVLNGMQVLKKVRELGNRVPIIVLTSRSSEMDEVVSMSYGADDFVRKPYSAQVLLLRIEAVLKRLQYPDVESIKYKEIEVILTKSLLRYGEKDLILSKNELAILSYLVKNHGKTMSRADIMDHLWEGDRFVDDNTLTVNINRLRRKLESVGLGGLISTRRAQGYILE